MSKRPAKTSKTASALPAGYAPLLAANRELLALYWDIGRLIVEAQCTKGYGRQVVTQLAADFQRAFPGVGGFSPLIIRSMRAFYAAYSDSTGILSRAVTESSPGPKLARLSTESRGEIAPPARMGESDVALMTTQPPQPFASLPWGQNLVPCTRGRAWRSPISRPRCRRCSPTSSRR